jgi:predicted DNA-binding antitoxin AbrB/MazE fold protein
MTIAAKYEEGVFKPLEEVTIKEGTVVQVRLPSCTDSLKAKSPLCPGL